MTKEKKIERYAQYVLTEMGSPMSEVMWLFNNINPEAQNDVLDFIDDMNKDELLHQTED